MREKRREGREGRGVEKEGEEEWKDGWRGVLILSLIFLSPTVSIDLLAADLRQMNQGLKKATAELIANRQNAQLKVR